MADVNTDRIETELLKNEMIAQVEAYKTPSGIIKLEVMQKMPILRIMGVRGSYYVDNWEPPCRSVVGMPRMCQL